MTRSEARALWLGDDQFDGFGFDDDDEGGEGGHFGAALRGLQGAAHAVEADADGDYLAGKGRADAAFLDLAFEGGDRQFGAGDRLFQGWVHPAFDLPQVHLRELKGDLLEGDLVCVAGIAGLLKEQLGAAGLQLRSFQIEGQFVFIDPEDAFGAGKVEAGLLQLFEQVGHYELGENLAFFGLFAFVDEDGAQLPVNGEGERLPTKWSDFGDDPEAVFDGAAGYCVPFLIRGHRCGPGRRGRNGANRCQAAGDCRGQQGQEQQYAVRQAGASARAL